MKTTITLAFLLMTVPVYAAPPAQSATVAPVVKLTASKICHGVGSPWYSRITRPVKTFKTMADCLAIEGTREPKNRKKKGGKQ